MTTTGDKSLAEMLTSGARLHVHLIGVAGSGMSGIAALLLALGHDVSGSDKVDTVEVQRLEKLGLRFFMPQQPKDVHGADLVIYSSAIKPGNPAYDEAAKAGIPMARRAEALVAVMSARKGVVVCGMHGKTTTSAMAAHVLRSAGLKPSHYVGAEIPILGTNAHWDQGELFVAEGDESDGTLRLFSPEHAIVLNIEEEHLDYYKDLDAIEEVFRQLLNQTSGKVFYCADDPHATRICRPRERSVSYGESPSARYRYQIIELSPFQSKFDLLVDGKRAGTAVLNVPGRHNVCNAVAVTALAMELGVPFNQIAEALELFRGAKRRFEVKYQSEDYLIIDDYGHHPSEVKATLATAKRVGRPRVVCLFQPHRYTRTLALKEEFGQAFGDADLLFITDVYPASEPPIPGVTGDTLVEAVKRNGHPGAEFVQAVSQMHKVVGPRIQRGDLIITLGAGNVHEQGNILAQELKLLSKFNELIGDGTVKLYEPFAKHTTLRVGGPAQFWAEPHTEKGFARLVDYCSAEQIPVTVIGRGSNLLVRDGGVRGLVIHPSGGEFDLLEVEGETITAGAGVKLKQLAYAAKAENIGGFEWMEGIPGEIGGGIRMNAGAMGSETFGQVVEVRYLNSYGQIREATPQELEIHYRDVPTFRKNYVLSAKFKGFPSNREEITRLLDASNEKRRSSQPAASSAGCIFKNPKDCPAGKLIDELGLKNMSVGPARVSDVHGNFIVNDGGASATEVLTLIEQIKARAIEKRGIRLETEVQILGEEA